MPTRAYHFDYLGHALCPAARSSLPPDGARRLIEWSVFDSDAVVRGVVTSLQTSTADPAFPYTIVSIKVLETLKGRPALTLIFLADTADTKVWNDGIPIFPSQNASTNR